MIEHEEPVVGGVGVALIGCGYWGKNYVRVLKELIEVETVAVCDSRAIRLKEIEEAFTGIETTTEVDEVLASDRIHAVIVATPATAHYDVTRRALLAGKHVLVEKPLTTVTDEGLELVALAERLGLTFSVGHTFLHNAAVEKMREYIASGQIGDLHYLYSRRTNLGPIRQDVSAFWDLAPHDVSIFNYLTQRSPQWVSAVASRPLRNGNADVGFATIGYGDDLVAHLHVSWADPFKVREVVAVGSQQRIVFDDINASEPIRVYEKGVRSVQHDQDGYGELPYRIRDGDIVSPKIEAREPLKSQVLSFLRDMALGERPKSDGWVGLSVVEVMRAIDASVERNGSPIEIAQLPRTEADGTVVVDLRNEPGEAPRVNTVVNG
jgi:predicted dehydrogenase